MRNLKLGLFTMLAMITAGIGFTAAFEIQVGPQDYYGTLTLNRINIMKNYGLTGIVLDGTGYEISIASGGTPGYGKISVYQICGQGGGNCKQVSQLSTSTPVMNSINDDGLVEKTNGEANKVRKTDTEGRPQWLDDADTHYTNTLTINGSGTQAINFSQDSSKTLNIKGSGNVSVSVNSSTNSADIIITSTGGGGTSLRQTSGTDFIKPENDSYNVTIGDIKIKTGDNGGCSTNQLIPGIIYTDQFFIRSSNYGGGCGIASKPIVMDSSGHVAINASLNESYATVIGGTTEINGSVTVEGEIVATSTLNTPSAVHTTSATINGNKFQNNKVGIQKTPGSSGEPLQINGGIQVSNYSTPTMNDTCSIEGAIEYYNGYFYGCAKKGNASAKRARLSIYFQEGQVYFD